LFADDANCFLSDYNDADQLEQCLDIYCQASGGKINFSKSLLYPLGKYRLPPLYQATWRTWKVDLVDEFRVLGVQVGIQVDTAAEWEKASKGVIHRMRTIPLYGLPISTRCSIINRYCYTKILYLDQFSPAPPDVIKRIEDAANQSIW
ncbi:hypothetical protein T439DRAFT_271246, partial [Meredithblackwellia eburnea MCA 4105]